MSTKECLDFVIKWTDENMESIPKEDRSYTLSEKRIKQLAIGHSRVKNWRRDGIKKDGNITYRAFYNSETLFSFCLLFLVVEENNTFRVEVGMYDDFKKYFTVLSGRTT